MNLVEKMNSSTEGRGFELTCHCIHFLYYKKINLVFLLSCGVCCEEGGMSDLEVVLFPRDDAEREREREKGREREREVLEREEEEEAIRKHLAALVELPLPQLLSLPQDQEER
jgi:hypothetical protein